MGLEQSSRQTYDKLLPHLNLLKTYHVGEMTPATIDDLVKEWVRIATNSQKRQTFAKELDLLKTILNFYKSRHNPTFVSPVLESHYAAADLAKRAEAPVASLTQQDLGRFLEALRMGRTPKYYPLALAQFCMGLRIGEACGLMWSHINLEDKTARIEWTIIWDQWTWKASPKPRPKNGKVRILVIPDLFVAELQKMKLLRDPNVDLVFHKNGEPLNRKTVGCGYNRALKRLGIHYVSGTHMLRKTSATQANDATGDFYAVSRLLDHSSPEQTLKYVSQTTTQKRKVADALNEVLKEALGEKSLPPQGPVSIEKRVPVPQCPPNEKRPILTLIKSSA